MNQKQIIKSLGALALSVALFFWFRGSSILLFSNDFAAILIAFGRLCGIGAVLSVLLQFLLMGRVKWIERAWGMDVLAHIHHKNGRYALYLMLAHFALILTSYSLSNQVNVFAQILDFWENYSDTLKASIALAIFIVTIIFSIFMSKIKPAYEFWYFVHLGNYVAILLVFGHQMKNGGDFYQDAFVAYWWSLYIFVFVNVLFYRFTIPVFNFLKYQFKVDRIVKETHEVYSVYITGRNIESFRRTAGQFMILRFLDSKRFWQAHPFSISWGGSNRMLRISVKNLGDFTAEIPTLKKGTPVVIDGPHGGFSLTKAHGKKILFIAGGIGITPIRAMLEDSDPRTEKILLYSNKLPADIALRGEIEDLSKSKKFEVFHFITEESMQKRQMTNKNGNNNSRGIIYSRIDSVQISKVVKDVSEWEVLLCGPKPFMNGVKEALLSLNVKKKNIYSEEFSLH